MSEYNFSENCGSKVITPSKGENLIIKYEHEEDTSFVCSWSGANLIIKNNATGDKFTIKNYANTAVSNFVFKSWSGEDEYYNEHIVVTSDDIFTLKLNATKGAKSTKTYVGNCLNQEIIASSKNDTIKSGGGSKNILFGGEGNDKLYGGKGSTIFLFGDGDVKLCDDKTKTVLDYYYQFEKDSNYKDGADTIYSSSSRDKIVFSHMSSLDELEFVRTGNNLTILDKANISNKVTISNFFGSTNPLDKVYFSTDMDRVISEQDDFVSLKNSGINILYTGKGKMKGSDYNEVILGSSKKDTIWTGKGIDSVYAGKGNDTVNINGDGQKLIYFEGVDVYDNTKLINEGNDTINISKNAEDKYIDTTLVFDYETTPETEKPSDLVPVSYSGATNGKDLIITHYFHPTSGDVQYIKDGTIKIKDYFANYTEDYLSTNGDVQICIGNIESGVKYNISDLLETTGVVINGNSKKKNTIYGTRFDDTISGGKKADKIYSGKGDDIIDAKKGSDKIYLDGEGDKEILLSKGAGKDRIEITNNNAKAKLTYGDGAVYSYTSNGTDVTINAKYDKKTTDKTTIADAFSHENDVKIGEDALADILSSEKISITGSYNKKKTIKTFTGTKYDDVVNGSSKKDIINVSGGDNTVNIGKKGASVITAGDGNDTYNAKNLSVSVKITDEGGNDTLNLSGVKISDINLLFDVTKSDGKTGDDLYLVNNKNMGLISSNKATMPKAGIDLVGYFGIGKIESVNLGDTLISSKFEAMITKITNEVKTFLDGTSYDSAFALLNDKSKGAKSLKKQLVSIYTKYKADQDYGMMSPRPVMMNTSSLMADVAAWQTSDSSFDAALAIDNNSDNMNVQTLIAEYNGAA